MAIFSSLQSETKKVALSLSNDPDEIKRVIRETKPDIIHIGAAIELLSPEQTRQVKSAFPNTQVMRAMPVTGEEATPRQIYLTRRPTGMLWSTAVSEHGSHVV